MILRRTGCAMALNTTSVEVIGREYISIRLWAREYENKAALRADLCCVATIGNDESHSRQ